MPPAREQTGPRHQQGGGQEDDKREPGEQGQGRGSPQGRF
jgi:hypothetical protein